MERSKKREEGQSLEKVFANEEGTGKEKRFLKKLLKYEVKGELIYIRSIMWDGKFQLQYFLFPNINIFIQSISIFILDRLLCLEL